SAIGLVARQKKIALPAEVAIDAEVDLSLGDGGYFLSARLNVSMPGVARHVAQALLNEAHQICPYSKATRGNIDVAVNLVRANHVSFGWKKENTPWPSPSKSTATPIASMSTVTRRSFGSCATCSA